MFFSLDHFYCKDTINKYSKYVDFKIDFEEKDIFSKFWANFIEVIVTETKRSDKNLKDYLDPQLVYKAFSEKPSALHSMTAFALSQQFPLFSLLNDIRLSSWHWYIENSNDPQFTLDTFNRFSNLPTPFGDSRFEALPVSCAYRRGFCDSPWLEDKDGAFVKDFKNNDIFRAVSADKSLFLDAKLAICLFFQNKPSIIVSFNMNKNKQIFIHQIQAQLKDRGHYKLGENWKFKALEYVKSVFHDFEFYMLDSQHIVDLVNSNYTDYEEFKPNEETIQRIYREYNSFNFTSQTITKQVYLDNFDYDKKFLYKRMLDF